MLWGVLPSMLLEVATGYLLGHLMLNRMAALASFAWSLRDNLSILRVQIFVFYSTLFFFLVLWVCMLFVDSSVQYRWWYFLFSGYFERFGLMTVLLVFFFIVYDATDYWKYFDRMDWNTSRHKWWNIWSRNYFCLLYTFSGCFLVLLNWAILQRRLLYANQVCCTVCSHKSLVGFFYFGELHATFHYTSYYSFVWLWHYVCSSLLLLLFW